MAEHLPVQQPPDAFNVKSNFFAKSLLVPEKEPLQMQALLTYFTNVVAQGNKFPAQWVFTFRLMGGPRSKVSAKGDSWSAVSNRNSLWIVQHDGETGRNPREVTRFIEDSTKTLQDAASGASWGSFAPFVDPTFTNAQAHQVYFSPSTYKTLSRLKKKWDKNDIFFNKHSVT
jgi:hypothetical protein